MPRNTNKWAKRRKPFSEIEEWTTEKGNSVSKGETVKVKPTYVRQKLPAKVVKIYWNPQGLPGGKYDHRGKVVSKPDYAKENPGDYKYENPSNYDCILTVLFEFTVASGHEYSHMNGKQRKVKGMNLDFALTFEE
jgi:hypothetical protein